ncbi:MAG: hypothetical protein E7241_09500 [Lachnospiraceae bacterium]|jgi:cell division protein DivIC|nr:hypothetical protein [Lachnospiraceae bacterium]
MARKRAVTRNNKKSMVYISGILTIMLTVLIVLSLKLNSQREALLAESKDLEYKKQVEQQRTEEINAFKDSTDTKEFIERTAKEKLGLLYENEIIFKKEK